jgi:hypothetical protein
MLQDFVYQMSTSIAEKLVVLNFSIFLRRRAVKMKKEQEKNKNGKEKEEKRSLTTSVCCRL